MSRRNSKLMIYILSSDIDAKDHECVDGVREETLESISITSK